MLKNIQQIKQHPRYKQASRLVKEVRTPEFRKKAAVGAATYTVLNAVELAALGLLGRKVYRQRKAISALTSRLHKSKARNIKLGKVYRGTTKRLGDRTTELEQLKSMPAVRKAINKRSALNKLRRLRDRAEGNLIRVQNSKAGPALGKLDELGPVFKMAAIQAGIL